MAKVSKDKTEEGAPLPGLDELMHGPKPKPVEASKAAPVSAEDAPDGPLPQPGEPPQPIGTKVRVKAGTAPIKGTSAKARKAPARKGPAARVLSLIKAKMWFLFPPDPVEQVRVKLRILGLVKFLVAPLVIVALVSLLMMFLWYTFWDYSEMVDILSRKVMAIILLLPAGIGIFMAVYIPLVVLLFNRYENRWNWALRNMLRKDIKFKIDKPTKASKARPAAAPKKAAAPVEEEPLPQPTVNAVET